jgi:hypothetical protein
MRIIYFSPHLDDAILSAGGLIYDQTQAGHSVEIWTFMCGFPEESELTDFAKSFMRNGERTPLKKPCASGVRRISRPQPWSARKPSTFDFLDCIYRRGKNGEALYPDIYVRYMQKNRTYPAHRRNHESSPET